MIYNGLKKNVKSKICIIGSGIGGGTIAKKLSEKNIPFIIIEAGSWSGDSKNVSYDNVGLDFGVRSTTTVQVGGTSNLWHGVLASLDKIDFEKRDWIPYSGWPITLNDLQPFYKEASDLLNIENYDYFNCEKLHQKFIDQLELLPFNRKYLKNKLFQQPTPPLNFKYIIKSICEKHCNYNLYFNATALELIHENSIIKKLKVGHQDGSFSYVEAETFIVSSGALESPRLLLNSNVDNNNLGKFLMDHPMGNLCQLKFLFPKKYPIYSDTRYSHRMKIKSGFELHDDMQKKLKLPNHNFYLRPSFIKGIDNESERVKLSLLAFKDGRLSLNDFWQVLTRPNVVFQILSYKFSLDIKFKYADLFFVTEQLPSKSSFVGLSENRDIWNYRKALVNWSVSDGDINFMKRWYKLVLTQLFPEEIYQFSHSLDDFNWESIFTSAIHHVGTCRMGHSSVDGVVDKNLNVFGFDNLYVCDGSVFTTAGNVNNGLSIAAFACKLVNYIRNLK